VTLEAVLTRNRSRAGCKRAHGYPGTYTTAMLLEQTGPTWPTTATTLARNGDKARRRGGDEWVRGTSVRFGERACHDDVGVASSLVGTTAAMPNPARRGAPANAVLHAQRGCCPKGLWIAWRLCSALGADLSTACVLSPRLWRLLWRVGLEKRRAPWRAEVGPYAHHTPPCITHYTLHIAHCTLHTTGSMHPYRLGNACELPKS
jgi:hypothetical protein